MNKDNNKKIAELTALKEGLISLSGELNQAYEMYCNFSQDEDDEIEGQRIGKNIYRLDQSILVIEEEILSLMKKSS